MMYSYIESIYTIHIYDIPRWLNPIIINRALTKFVNCKLQQCHGING